jgi:predicted ABC-type transport system involved in lysophospholipase L1 biosynthesis ATPase subunit
MTNSILSVEHLSKVFKSGEHIVHVLSDVSFAIEEGSTCAIVGPSGSGKTTLIAICAGLERASEGSVSLGGTALHGASELASTAGAATRSWCAFPAIRPGGLPAMTLGRIS